MTTLVAALGGLAMGSFVNAWVWRLKNDQSVWRGRSHCPNCRKILGPIELIPLFSFLIQKGRCRGCQQPISWQYPLVELAVALLFVLAAEMFDGLTLVHNLFLIVIFMAILVFDARYMLIPDQITLPAILLSGIFNIRIGLDWQNLLIGAIVGFGFFAVQYLISKGRWLGSGDLRLGTLMGVAFGWPLVILAVFLGYLIGSIMSLPKLFKNKPAWKSEVPLGAYLSLASLVMIFGGDWLWQWYWQQLI